MLGHERRAEPTIGELTGHLETPRSQGGEVDRNVWPGPSRRAKGLALATGQRQLVDGAAIREPLTARDAPHDLNRLAHALNGPLETESVPALDDLGRADTQSEDEAVAGHRRQAHRGHRHERGR